MAAALHINGERTTGQDVRTQNTMAVVAVANILKTSLGPVGLDKVRLRGSGAASRPRRARRADRARRRRPRPPPPARRRCLSSLTRLLYTPTHRCSSTTSAT